MLSSNKLVKDTVATSSSKPQVYKKVEEILQAMVHGQEELSDRTSQLEIPEDKKESIQNAIRKLKQEDDIFSIKNKSEMAAVRGRSIYSSFLKRLRLDGGDKVIMEPK